MKQWCSQFEGGLHDRNTRFLVIQGYTQVLACPRMTGQSTGGDIQFVSLVNGCTRHDAVVSLGKVSSVVPKLFILSYEKDSRAWSSKGERNADLDSRRYFLFQRYFPRVPVHHAIDRRLVLSRTAVEMFSTCRRQ